MISSISEVVYALTTISCLQMSLMACNIFCF